MLNYYKVLWSKVEIIIAICVKICFIVEYIIIFFEIRFSREFFSGNLWLEFLRNAVYLIAFDEGRTLPNLLGYLWSRRCPVHASESWPVFFRSIGRPFIFSAPFWMTSQFRCAKDAASCIAVCRTFEDVVVRWWRFKLYCPFIAVWFKTFSYTE